MVTAGDKPKSWNKLGWARASWAGLGQAGWGWGKLGGAGASWVELVQAGWGWGKWVEQGEEELE